MLKNSFRKRKIKSPAYDEGRTAFLNGLELSDNPYTDSNSELKLIWASGWEDASDSRKDFERTMLIKESRKKGKRKYKEAYSQIANRLAKCIIYVIIPVGGFSILWGIFTFGYQIFFWLKTGEWVKLPMSYFFITPSDRWASMSPADLVPSWFHNSWNWFEYPASWYGVNKIVRFIFDLIPLSIVWIIVGIYFVGAGISFSEKLLTKKTA